MTPTKRLLTSAGLAGAMFAGGVFGVANVDIGTAGAQDSDAPQVETPGQDDTEAKEGRRGGKGEAQQAKAAGLAEILGITAEELTTQLRDGATLAEVAEANGVATQTVVDYIVEQHTARIDAAVEDGRITEEEAAEKLAGLADHAEAKVNGEITKGDHGKRGNKGKHAKKGHHGDKGAKLDSLSEVLGLEADELRTELQSGATIADIAAAQGVSVEAVVDALVADATEKVDAAVEAGRIDAEQAAEKIDEIEEKVTDIVNGEGEVRGEREGRRGHRGHGGAADDAEGTDTDA